MQSENGFMDQVARLMTNAAGAAKGLRDEFATIAKTRAEKIVNDLELVPREEFDAMKRLALRAHAQIADMTERLKVLENQMRARVSSRSQKPTKSLNRKLKRPAKTRLR